DGVHLNKAGMQAMFDYIRTHAYITKDTRPKPLTKVPKRDETPTGIISQDPLAVRGARVRLLFTSSDTELGKIEGEIEQKIKRTLTSDTVTAVPNLENGGIFTGWTSNQSGLSSASDQSVKFTVPKLGDDVNEVSIVANFKKAAITIKHNSDVKTAITLEKSAGISLVAEVSPEFTGDKKLTWQSDDSSIVTVDANGNVKAVSGGVTKVYASILGGKIYSSCTVTVNQALESISIKGDGNVKTGGTVQLTLALNPTGANVDKNTAVWSSGDDTVASVSSSGLVTAHNKDGTAVITCTLGGKTAQHTIKVSAPKPITGISITGPQTVFEGLSIQLAVAYAPADTTDPKTALWTSDNTSVASVVDGTVTGIAQGTANITCTVGSHTAKVSITVTQEKNYVHSVSISSTHIDIAVGASSPLSASAVLAYPQRPDGVDVTQHWASASGYINISGGVITVKEGLTSPSGTLSDTVTVTIGGKTNSCTVTITGVTVPQGENTEGGTPTPEITPSPAA
ncbi:MAG: Ig-like domain-containing protein, partial [Oscillospiraceae bacterium]